MKNFLLIIFALILIPMVSAVSVDNFIIDNTIHNQNTNYSSFVSDDALNMCWFEFGYNNNFFNNSHNDISGTNAYCFNISNMAFPAGYDVTVRAWVNGTAGDLNYSEQNITISDQEGALNLNSCPDNIPLTLILFIVVGITLFFIYVALRFTSKEVGVLASLMMMVSAWLLSPCHQLFAYIYGALAIVLFIMFALMKT